MDAGAANTGVSYADGPLGEAELDYGWFQGGDGSYFLGLSLSSEPTACMHALEYGREPANSWSMALSLERMDPTRAPLEPGSYAIGRTASEAGDVVLAAILQRTDDACRNTLGDGPGPLTAESGVLDIEVLGADEVIGRYSLTFADGRIEGQVVATECGVPSVGSPLCLPAE